MGEVLNTSNNVTFLSVGLHHAKGRGGIEPDTRPAGDFVQLGKESVNSLTTGNERVEELKQFTRELRIDNKKIQEECGFLCSIFESKKAQSENNIEIYQNIEKLTRLNEERDHLLQGNSSSENDIEKNSEEIKETSKKLEDLTQKKNRELPRLAGLEKSLSRSFTKIELATHSMSSNAAAHQTILKQVTPWLSKIDPEKLEKQIKGEMAEVPRLQKDPEMQAVSDTLLDNHMFSPPIQQNGTTEEKMLSSSEIADKLVEGINNVKNHYLDIYQAAAQKYADFYKDFSALVTKMSKLTTSNGDKIKIDVANLKIELDALKRDHYAPFSANSEGGKLYSVGYIESDGDSIAEAKAKAEKWAENFGLSSSNVHLDRNSKKFVVYIDFDPVEKIIASLPEPNKDMTATEHQKFQVGFDIQKDAIENRVNTLFKKLSQANAVYDNVVRILSQTIQTLLETDKAFL